MTGFEASVLDAFGRGSDSARRFRARSPVDAGRIADHPFVRVGTGPRRLVIVPGLNDPLTRVTDASWFAAIAMGYCARYAGLQCGQESRRVYMVSRPSGGSVETVDGMAAGYTTVLREIGPSDLLGLSMGGFVVARVAAEHPALVGRTILGLAASRLSAEGRETVARWRRWAEQERWLSIYREAVDAVSLGWRRRALRVAAQGYDALVDGPAHPRAFRAEARACLSYDGTDRLERIDASTLVIGADRDPFFSARDYREAADLLPDGSLCLLSGIGHQAVLERRRAFDDAVLTHLQGGE